MNEKPLNLREARSPAEREREKEATKREVIALAMRIIENKNDFPFPGITRDLYLRMKEQEKGEEEEILFITPIDELLERFNREGMKVVVEKNSASGAMHVLPLGSHDVNSDGILPEKLEINNMMDNDLRELILKKQGFARLCK